jgi:hypothetical protein
VSTYRGQCRCCRDSYVSPRPSNTLPFLAAAGGRAVANAESKHSAVSSSLNVLLARTADADLLDSLLRSLAHQEPVIFHFEYEISCRSESSNISLVVFLDY